MLERRYMWWMKVAIGMIVLSLSLCATGLLGRAAPQYQARSVITYPSDGMTISGAVDVIGIATHPNMRFYQLRYAAGPQPTGDSQWVDFAIVEATQVDNDVLATWDTTLIPDGVYTLALAVWGQDDPSSPYVFFVTNLTVNNAQPVVEEPTPTTEPPTAEPTLPPAAPVATPTSVMVEQPPTATPRPTSPSEEGGPGAEGEEGTPSAGDETGDDDGLKLPVNMQQIRDGFYAGAMLTVMLFLMWGLYVLTKAIVRWLLRRQSRTPWQ